MEHVLIVICGVLLYAGHGLLGAQETVPQYAIASRIHLEGDGGWDYCVLDAPSRRLFVSHGTMVQVIDLTTGKLAGTIADLKGVHGVALAPDLNKGFTSNGRDNSVTVFDLRTLAPTATVPVTGRSPDAIVYDSFSHLVFTLNGGTTDATVIDARTDTVAGTIRLEGRPEAAVTDGSGKLYVNIEDKSRVSVINAGTLKVEQSWPLAPGEEPTGLAIDPENHRLFSVCRNRLMVVLDTQDGRIVATLPIGERVDGAAFDAVNRRAYSSNGDGTLTVVQETAKDSFKVVATVATQKGARTMALDAKTQHLFLPVAEFEPASGPTAGNPRQRPPVKTGSFVVLEVAPVGN